MPGVGQERQGVAEQAVDRFPHHEAGVQQRAHGEGEAEAGRRVAVAVMAMAMVRMAVAPIPVVVMRVAVPVAPMVVAGVIVIGVIVGHARRGSWPRPPAGGAVGICAARP